MDVDQFMAEAELLARPAKLLRRHGAGAPVAYWQGRRSRTRHLSLRRGRRWLNVTLPRVEDPTVALAAEPSVSAVPLYAEEFVSLPPVDAVFLRGSRAVEIYLKRLGWQRTWAFNDNFRDPVPHEYEVRWQESCPLYWPDEAGIVAVVGGWPVPWADGDFEELIDSELVLWILEGAEPWIEIFATKSGFDVRVRLT